MKIAKTMLKNIYFLISILFYLNCSLAKADNMEMKEIDENIYNLTFNIDINNDGIRDQIFTEQVGNRLYIHLSTGENIESVNFSIDGYSLIDNILPLENKGSGFIIINRGSNFGAYFYNTIKLINKRYTLTHTKSSMKSNIDGVISSYRECNYEQLITLDSPDVYEKYDSELLPIDNVNFSKYCFEEITTSYDLSKLEQLAFNGQLWWEDETIDYFLKEFPISKKTVENYNNIAFYLNKKNVNNQQSIYLLKNILLKFPQRAVAYLNLGDAYFSIDDKKNATDAYQIYIEKMKTLEKEKSIPEYIKNRIKY